VYQNPAVAVAGDSPLRFYPKFDIDQWRWCIAFARLQSPAGGDFNCNLLRLAYYSRQRSTISSPANRCFDYRRMALVIFSDHESFDGAKRTLDFQRAFGSEQHALIVINVSHWSPRCSISASAQPVFIRPRKMPAIAMTSVSAWKPC
jgi:hypothetical protein